MPASVVVQFLRIPASLLSTLLEVARPLPPSAPLLRLLHTNHAQYRQPGKAYLCHLIPCPLTCVAMTDEAYGTQSCEVRFLQLLPFLFEGRIEL
jgi:hypothetical protein